MKSQIYFVIVFTICCLCYSCTKKEPMGNTNRTEFHTKGSKGAVYDKAFNKYVTDFIFDSYRPLAIADIPFGDHFFELSANGKHYLCDVSVALIIFNGKPYKLNKDNGGNIYAQTDDGLWPLTNESGLPECVSSIYRSGRAFIYSEKDLYGVYYYTASSRGLTTILSYKSIIPAIYDRIIHILGDGADHFIVCRNNQWTIIDVKGRTRDMCYDGDQYALRIFDYEMDVTRSYLKNILDIPLNTTNKYVAKFRTHCTHTGNKNTSTIRFENNSNRLNSLFHSYGGDLSDADIPK